MRVFLRDRFRDRYTGQRLVFPGTLRLLSVILPEEFPAHRNWKMSESHVVYWELFPTIDHIVPIGRGGVDREENRVTTSMLRNSAKAHWTLKELGWTLREREESDEWDGLLYWCLDYATEHPGLLTDKYLHRWHTAATRVLRASHCGSCQ